MVRSFFGFTGRRGFELTDVFENFFKEISGLYYLTRSTLYCTFIEPLRGKSDEVPVPLAEATAPGQANIRMKRLDKVSGN